PFYCSRAPPSLHSFPTRRSSDLEEILRVLSDRYGPAESLPAPGSPSAPAEAFRLSDGTVFGIIASVTQPFCRDCDRSRITADGRSEEHTSELQSRFDLVCRLLLE